MKKFSIYFIVVLASTLSSCNSNPAQKDVNFKVWGNCEMCKETIESSLKKEGIYSATWNVDSKIIEIAFDSTRYSTASMYNLIAAVGYDNVAVRGNDSAYANLPDCCQYERKP